MKEERQPYDLEELIEKIEDIRTGSGDSLNFPSALLCLAKQIDGIQTYLYRLHQIIPQKYKKFNPEPGENPFFSKEDFFPEVKPNAEDYAAAKERVRLINEKIEAEKLKAKPISLEESQSAS